MAAGHVAQAQQRMFGKTLVTHQTGPAGKEVRRVYIEHGYDIANELYVGAVMFGLGFGGLVPLYAVVLRSIYAAHTMGWRVGAILLFGAVGMAVGGQAAGALFDWMATYRVAFAIGLAFNIANLMLIYSVWRLTGGPGRRRIAVA